MRGYCLLCRTKEFELFNDIAKTDREHIIACEKAGCGHPAIYGKPKMESTKLKVFIADGKNRSEAHCQIESMFNEWAKDREIIVAKNPIVNFDRDGEGWTIVLYVYYKEVNK